jgi:signal peptidase II
MKLHRPPWPGLLAAALILVADQVTKLLVVHYRARLPWFFFGNVRIEYTQNTGMSFSLLRGQGAVLLVVVALITAGVAVGLAATPRRYAVALGLILGGSLGNLVDRIRLGHVVDFVGFYSWPTFNVADAALVAGIAVLVLAVLWPQKKRE